MLEQVKRIARQTGEAETPARFLFGTVTALAPLTVLVDSRYYLTETADPRTSPVVVLKELYGHLHTVPQHTTRAAQSHTHTVDALNSGTAEALAVGNKVALLRNHGGQQYLLLGRV